MLSGSLRSWRRWQGLINRLLSDYNASFLFPFIEDPFAFLHLSSQLLVNNDRSSGRQGRETEAKGPLPEVAAHLATGKENVEE